MRSVRDSGSVSAGAEMIWGALDWLRRLARRTPPSRPTGREQFQAKTRNELLALAKEVGIQGRHRMSKRDLVASLSPPASSGTLAKDTPVDSMKKPAGQEEPARATGIARSALSPAGATGSLKVSRSAKPRGRAVVRPRVDETEPPPEELTELPTSYRPPRLTLLEVEPCRVHAYWEVTPQDCDAALKRLGPQPTSAAWVLRFYDVTYIDFDGSNAHTYFDVSIDTIASGWYVDLWSGDKSYCAEIGVRAPDGRFAPVCRSNFVDLPRTEPAPLYGPQWLNVDGACKIAERVPEPEPEGGLREPATISVPAVYDDSAGEGVPSPEEELLPWPVELAGGDGDGASVEPRGVNLPPVTRQGGQTDSQGHAACAGQRGKNSILVGQPVGQAEGEREVDNDSAAVGLASPEDAGSIPRPIELAGGDGNGASVEPRGVNSAPVTRQAGQTDGQGHAACAGQRGETSIPVAWPVVPTEGTRCAASVAPGGAASLSLSMAQGGGDGGQVSIEPQRVASMPIPQPTGRADAEGQIASAATPGATRLGQPSPYQAVGEVPQISNVEMRRRYGELLARVPPTASQLETRARHKPGFVPEAAPLQIRVEGAQQTLASSESVSSFGSGGSWDLSNPKAVGAIDLRLNAEVVISGRAQPGQTVQVNGRWLKVGADGTFSLRLALPVAREHSEPSGK